MDTKFTLTIYDIVSHLIPGVLLLLSVDYFTNFDKDLPTSLLLIYLLFGGYAVGLILHMIGLLLFRPVFKENYQRSSIKYKLVNWMDKFVSFFPLMKTKRIDLPLQTKLIQLVNHKYGIDFTDNKLGLYAFCDTVVAASTFQERDTLMAKEGLFRSMTVLFIFEVVLFCIFASFIPKIVVLIIGMVLIEMFRFGREYYRTLKNQQIYILAFLKYKE